MYQETKDESGWIKGDIKVARRNINLRYAYDTTLMAEREEELRSLLMRVKKSEQAGLKLNIQKSVIKAASHIISLQAEGEKEEAVTGFFLGLPNHCRQRLQPWN